MGVEGKDSCGKAQSGGLPLVGDDIGIEPTRDEGFLGAFGAVGVAHRLGSRRIVPPLAFFVDTLANTTLHNHDRDPYSCRYFGYPHYRHGG